MDAPLGSYIAGAWVPAPQDGPRVRSLNPARSGDAVFDTTSSVDHVDLAVAAALEAWEAWSSTPEGERVGTLRRFAEELAARRDLLAEAITAEMGKPLSEARVEAKSLVARVGLVADKQLPRVASWTADGVQGECRYHPLGVIGVIGPFNYPLHLMHAHAIPALATGNTVVLKPSERTPLAAQRYVEAWQAAGLPPVLQMVQGARDVGEALVAHAGIRGIAFTGSWRGGHAIQRALVDRPEVLAALEMGGQNMAIVLDDADLDQAVEGLLIGAFATSGQRCTCTSRALVHRDVADALLARLVPAAAALRVGDPTTDVFMGPMASETDRDHVEALCASAVDAGAEVLLQATHPPGGAYRTPSIHAIPSDHRSRYTDEEVFGPDLAVTVIDDLDEALSIVRASPFGLSLAIFTADEAAFERAYQTTRVGALNWNRSTNRATGAFPFGGVGRSGNFRPAGADAVRYTTYPVQVQWNAPGVLEEPAHVKDAMQAAAPLDALERRHRLEEAAEPYGLYVDVADDGVVTIPRAQLDLDDGPGLAKLSDALADALIREFAGLDVGLGRDEASLTLTVPIGGDREAAAALGRALHAIRPLHPRRFLGRRPQGAHVPGGEALRLPRSEAFMARVTDGEFVLPDKKPPVVDLFRSSGPYLASVDDDPLVIQDAASQIASHACGFNGAPMLEALHTGRFGLLPASNPDTRERPTPELDALARTLREATCHTLPHVTFCGSGAEANELAIRVSGQMRPGTKRLIAFEGSFHGRSILAIHTTWNPVKREPFKLLGHQASWSPWPTWHKHDPAEAAEGGGDPHVGLEEWTQRRGSGARAVPDGASALLAREIEALKAVEAAMEDDLATAVWIEPMQCEGGERYATPRFFCRLRALTEAYGVPLVFDEVQTGFHLGGHFWWYAHFGLQSPPDLVITAKKCQVGAVLSRVPSGVTSEAHVTSALRGALHAQWLARPEHDAGRWESVVEERLAEVVARHPSVASAPRAQGFAFGLDLPDGDAVKHVIGQRSWRAWMLYGAGPNALRFRLSPAFGRRAIDGTFERLDASLAALASGEPTTWRDGGAVPDEAKPWPPRRRVMPDGYRLVDVPSDELAAFMADVASLQELVYEPARRDDLSLFQALLAHPDSQTLAVYADGAPGQEPALVATAFAMPLELVADVDGPKQDVTLGQGVTLYAADLTVHPDHRRRGLGLLLKEAQVRLGMTASRPDGEPRFLFITGRNRLGMTDQVASLNAQFGAWEVAQYRGQYGETDGVASYYRIALQTPRLEALPPLVAAGQRGAGALLDMAHGLTTPGGSLSRVSGLVDETLDGLRAGRLNGAIANKVSLGNFYSPFTVRALEHLKSLAPKGLGHLVLASSRNEIVDKGLRAFKFHRGDARIALALGPVTLGETTAAARSLSLPADHEANWFGWPTLPDPSRDVDATIAALDAQIAQHGADALFGCVVEAVSQATGRSPSDDAWRALRAACDRHGVPLVVVEHASGGFRGGRGMWATDTLPIAPDAVWWAPGGQLGLVFLSDQAHVSKPLTLISTWEGDELSLIRLSWSLRHARAADVAARGRQLADALAPLGDSHGAGLYRVVPIDDAEGVRARLRASHVQAGLAPGGGGLVFAPPIDVDEATIAVLADVVAEVASRG